VAQLGVPVVTRSYTLAPARGLAVDYRTATPYGGVAAAVEVRPLRDRTDAASGLALRAEGSRGFLRTRLAGPAGVDAVLSSSDTEAAIDALYRYRFADAGTYAPELSAVAGAGLHDFAVSANPYLQGSSRRGLRLGAEVAETLVPGWLTARLTGTVLPLYGPGDAERKAYGESASGYGLTGSVGLEGGLAALLPGLGWSAHFEATRFTDSYQSGKLQGSASEGYRGVVAAATYAY
jgi:hypothetical protein